MQSRFAGRVQRRCRGFTLLELTVVLAVTGVIAAGSMALYHASATRVQSVQSTAQLSQVRQALIEFAGLNHRLPYASDGSGAEVQGRYSGFVPTAALGLTMPAANGITVMHYAVFGEATPADLTRPAASAGQLGAAIQGAGLITDGSLEMMQALRWIGNQPARADQPYVTAFGGDCGSPGFNVAFALSIDPTNDPANTPCFAQSSAQNTVWATAYELLDTVNSNAR